MWFDPGSTASVRSKLLRHEAKQDDGLASYGWLRHDGRSFGRQQLVDKDYNISVTMVSCFFAGSTESWFNSRYW